jgi:GNAT superfamily N-acetyltransferase
MTIEVRPVTPDEYEEAGAVTSLAYREFVKPGEADWERYLDEIADVAGRAPRALVLIAVEDGRILGTATLELAARIDDDDPPLRGDEAHIRMLGVHPGARGRGIGKLLMDAVKDRATREGKTLLTLHTTRRMRAARAMYEGMGFTRLADRVLESGFVLLSYSLPLTRTQVGPAD